MPRIDVTGDICLRRTRPAQGCRAAASDDDDGNLYFNFVKNGDWT